MFVLTRYLGQEVLEEKVRLSVLHLGTFLRDIRLWADVDDTTSLPPFRDI